MGISYIEWLIQTPELQNPLMFDNSEFIKKLSQDEFDQMLQFLFSIMKNDRLNVKNNIVTILNNSYIQQNNKTISKIDIYNIKNYIERLL